MAIKKGGIWSPFLFAGVSYCIYFVAFFRVATIYNSLCLACVLVPFYTMSIMKLVVQRVSQASVSVDGAVVGAIERGFMVLLGIHKDDALALCDKAIHKLLNLRLFSDEAGKMNLSVQDVQGGILLVSQFTLYGDCRKGNRPSFIDAMPPNEAEAFYNEFVARLKSVYSNVAFGCFGADMHVSLINSGPVTVALEIT